LVDCSKRESTFQQVARRHFQEIIVADGSRWLMTPEEELARIIIGVSLTVFLFWFGAYLETLRKRMMTKVAVLLDKPEEVSEVK
jgi:hypothetical protein